MSPVSHQTIKLSKDKHRSADGAGRPARALGCLDDAAARAQLEPASPDQTGQPNHWSGQANDLWRARREIGLESIRPIARNHSAGRPSRRPWRSSAGSGK